MVERTFSFHSVCCQLVVWRGCALKSGYEWSYKLGRQTASTRHRCTQTRPRILLTSFCTAQVPHKAGGLLPKLIRQRGDGRRQVDTAE